MLHAFKNGIPRIFFCPYSRESTGGVELQNGFVGFAAGPFSDAASSR